MEPSDLSLLATLDALLQEGSVTGAAKRVGLSTPAMSHALARIRDRLSNPILVRAGRGMVLTPRAEALKPRVHTLVREAQQALEAERPFIPSELHRSFVVLTTDYVLCMLGLAVDRILMQEAPNLMLRFVPNSSDDPAVLRDGGADLAIGIYEDLPPEVKTRPLLTDRFVVALRRNHPTVGRRLSLEQFVRLPHLQIALRGRSGYVDGLLKGKGLTRRVARAIPYVLPALYVLSKTDYLLVVCQRVVEELAPALGLRTLNPPVELRPYTLSLVWHPRFDRDAGHRFLRDVFARAAQKKAGGNHEGARADLERANPASRKPAPRRRRP
jgi:DNA-binding transcriptional LysR family regulator